MSLIKVSDLFLVTYGSNLELNRLSLDPEGINFVSRTSKNNGVSARVAPIEGKQPIPAGTISVAGGGSVMESFLQPKPYYSGRDIYILTPKTELTDREKLYYCACLKANKYRYNYGRQSNRSLPDLMIPDKEGLPKWVYNAVVPDYDNISRPLLQPTPPLQTINWKWFRLDELFTIMKGKRLTKSSMKKGDVPFIGAINSNNGWREYIRQDPIHEGNTITVNYNGSVAEAFYQPIPFWASDDVNVLYPKFEMDKYIALFIVSLIKLEKYRFNYGRKWHKDRMETSEIMLPVDLKCVPDWQFMRDYIKSLKYSANI